MPNSVCAKYFLLLFSVLVLAGCALTPKPATSNTPSWDGNTQNSGISEFLDDGVIVSATDRDIYNILIKMYGDEMIPPIKKDYGMVEMPDGKWKMTYEAISKWNMLKLKYQNSKIKPGK